MDIRLDQIGPRPFTWRETLDFDDTESGAAAADEVVTVGPVDVRGSVDPTHQGFVLRAQLAYRQTLQCVRCLTSFEDPVDTEVGLMLIDAESAERDAPGEELSREDLGVVVYEDPTFDTRPMVVEQVQLQFPMKPLCRPDCAGLCSRCGADLNNEPCTCQPDVDPRWASLAALRGGDDS